MRYIVAINLIFVLALPCPALGQSSVVNYLAANGSEVHIELDTRFPSRVQRLRPDRQIAAGVPVLHQDSKQKGKVASLVKDNKLIIWQLSRAGSGRAAQATRSTIGLGRPKPNIVPNWWPRLTKPWARRADDQHSVTTTLMGWTGHGIAATRIRIVAAAKRGGLRPMGLTRSRVAQSDGDLVFLTGPGKEMMVTFSRMGRLTGVVAHLTEAK